MPRVPVGPFVLRPSTTSVSFESSSFTFLLALLPIFEPLRALAKSTSSPRPLKGGLRSGSVLGLGLGGANGVEAPLFIPVLLTPVPRPANILENSLFMVGSVDGPRF